MKMKNNYIVVLLFLVIAFANFMAVSYKSEGSSISLDNIFQTAIAQQENGCNCPGGYGCVNGVCVQLEQLLYQSCTTEKTCYWLGFIPYTESCAGHKYNCNASPNGTTNCSNTNCECDQDPC